MCTNSLALKLQYIALLLISLTVFSCKNDEALLEALREEEQAGVEHAKDVRILYSDSARLQVRIDAETMLNHLDPERPRREFPDGVLVVFFNDFEQPTSQLSSRWAEYLEVERKVYLRDSVVVWNEENERLETEELIWNERDSSIYSEKFVKITTPSQIIYGYGFRSNAAFSEWEIDKVRGRVQSESFLANPLKEEDAKIEEEQGGI